eukprot:12581247-Alexandrium_andersonii.AAC.1
MPGSPQRKSSQAKRGDRSRPRAGSGCICRCRRIPSCSGTAHRGGPAPRCQACSPSPSAAGWGCSGSATRRA